MAPVKGKDRAEGQRHVESLITTDADPLTRLRHVDRVEDLHQGSMLPRASGRSPKPFSPSCSDLNDHNPSRLKTAVWVS